MAEEQIYDDVTTGEPEPLRKVYDAVFERKDYHGTYDEFKKKYSDPAERERLFNYVKEKELYTKSRQDFDAKYFAPAKSTKPDLLTRMPSTATSRESTNVGSLAASKDRLSKVTKFESGEEFFARKLDKSQKTLQNEVIANDDVVEDMVREARYVKATNERQQRLDAAPRSDMPGMPPPNLGNLAQPEVKPQDQPVTAEDIAKTRKDLAQDPQFTRHFIGKIVEKNKEKDPAKAKEIQASLYLTDAVESTKGDPNAEKRLVKIAKNAAKLESGEYTYNPTLGRLERPEGFLDAAITGLTERTKQLGDYKAYQQDDATVIKLLEEEMNQVSDDAVPVPAGGAGEFGSMLGMESVAMAKGGGATALTSLIPGGQAAAPFVGAAVTAPEYYERGYATALKETYFKLRQEGKSPEEALATARDQAKTEGKLSAAEGAVSAVLGGRIGLRPLPKLNFTGSFAKAASNVLKQTLHYGKEATLDGLTDGLVAGYLQEEKNVAAKERGIHRQEGEGIWDNIKGELMFSLGMAGVTKAGRVAIDPKTYQTLLRNIANQDEAQIDQQLGNMVLEGKITEEDAKETKQDIMQQKKLNESIPPDVAEKSVEKIERRIGKRNELEAQLEKADKAFHPEIKEKIKKLNEEIVELSKDKEEKVDETQTEKAPEKETVPLPEEKAVEEKPVEEIKPVEEPQKAEAKEKEPTVADEEKPSEKLQTEEAKAFRQHVYDTIPLVTSSDYDQRINIPGMQQSERERAVKAIQAGKENAATRKLNAAIDEMIETGKVSFVRHKETTEMDLADYMAELNKPSEQIDFDLDTPQKISEALKNLFDEPVAKKEAAAPVVDAKQEPAPQKSTDIKEGSWLTITHAGNPVTGKVVEMLPDGRYKVQDRKGIKYIVKPKDVTENLGRALPKIDAVRGEVMRPKNDDTKQYTPQSIIDKSREYFKEDEAIQRVADFLEPIIKANPNIRIDHEAEIKDNVAGLSFEDGRIELNFDLLQDYDSLYRTGLHEMLHTATRNELEKNTAFREEVDKILSKAREALEVPDSDFGVQTAINILNSQGKLNLNLYGVTNAHELVAEIFTNPEFRKFLSEIKYENTNENFLQRIFRIIAEFLSKNYKQLAEAKKQISADNLAEYLMQLTESVVSGSQGEDSAGALPSKAYSNSKEDAIKKIIRRAPKSISDETLRKEIVDATGLDEDLVQKWIDEVRKPPVPPPPTFTSGELSPQERNISLKKFDKLFDKKGIEKPKWWKPVLSNLQNLSAWWDNPFRFVTKITEDINKEYQREEREVIPLGRAFEKSASGRAILRVQEFVNEVLLGKIGDENYGRISGEKLLDFQKYLAAKRVIDRLQTERRKRKAGEHANRSTGNITEQDAEVMLQELEQKYAPKTSTDVIANTGQSSALGSNPGQALQQKGALGPSQPGASGMEDFEARAEAFHKHADTMMRNLTASGVISKETYEQAKADNNFYAPFNIIQERLLADQTAQPQGIQGVVKRIKGIDPTLPTTTEKALEFINVLAKAVDDKIIQPEEYFRVALIGLNNLLYLGKIDQATFDNMVARLENPGFALNNMIDAMANMIYKAEGMALKNRMMQRLYEYKQYDTKGMFIQDVDGFTPMQFGGETRMVPKPLNTIPVEPGMAPIKLKVNGETKIVAVDKRAAKKLNEINNFETHWMLKGVDLINKLFRLAVITLSPGFQAVNFVIDFVRTAMLSRYGLFAGKSMAQSLANAILFAPQYVDGLLHSALGNAGFKTDTYKKWMESDSFSKGMFDNLFDNERRIREMTGDRSRRFFKELPRTIEKVIEYIGTSLEQAPKIAVHERGKSVEGFKPEMFTAMISSIINKNINENMNKDELKEAADKINYEVQNMAGSPNFPQLHKALKALSIVFQFFGARVKGEMSDFRRIGNIFLGRGEGVKLSKQETIQMATQFAAMAGVIGAYAVKNILDDDDEEQFDSVSAYQRDNYLHIPAGTFEFEFEDGTRQTFRDYIKIPLRGITSTMNVTAQSLVKFWKRHNPEEFKKAATNFLGNASPLNLHGDDTRQMGESVVSNLTPVFKYFMEYSFNRDTHNHRDLISERGFDGGVLQAYKDWLDSDEPDLEKRPGIAPWEVANKKTPEWAKELSKFLYEHLGIAAAAITLDHMENTMGNPTELYDNAVQKRLVRSKSKYPVKGATGKVVEPEEETIEE